MQATKLHLASTYSAREHDIMCDMARHMHRPRGQRVLRLSGSADTLSRNRDGPRLAAARRPVHSNQSCHPRARRPSHRGRRSKERRNERVRALFESLVTVLCWRARTVQSRQNAFLPAPSSPRCERAHPAVSEVPVDALWLSPPCSSLRVVVGTKRARARAAQAP
jgi:hypothetical protein